MRLVNRTSHERLDYPTQKPENLLERIITMSTGEGDLIQSPAVPDFLLLVEKFNINGSVLISESLEYTQRGSDIGCREN